jgi:hypothetical protein
MAAALSLLFLGGSAYTCIDETGQPVMLMLSGSLTDKAGQSFAQVGPLWPVTAIIILIAAFSLTSIFLYRRRDIQMKVVMALIILSVCFIAAMGYYGYVVVSSYKLSIVPGFRTGIPPVVLILSILAYLGIRRDDRLVRSYDRLR